LSSKLYVELVDWVTCNKDGFRYGAFMSACPKCGTKNPSLLDNTMQKENEKQTRNRFSVLQRFGRKRTIVVISAFVLFGAVFGTILVANSFFARDRSNLLPALIHNTLNRINEDRIKYGLQPVQISYNKAAQAHANELLKTHHLSHWTTDGMKPYMRYSVYDGHDSVTQNVAEDGFGIRGTTPGSIFSENNPVNNAFDDLRLAMCKVGIAICDTLNPYIAVNDLEYEMMYNDQDHGNGHRLNILDKNHTHVSLGIAYDNYYLALVQNFEDKYTIWSTPISYDNSTNTVSMGGTIKNNLNLYAITIGYDPLPSYDIYIHNRDKQSYSEGMSIAFVLPHLQGYHYNATKHNVSIVETNKWSIRWNENTDKNTANQDKSNNNEHFEISFPIDRLTKMYGKGVYTINLWYKSSEGDPFEATTVSLFVDK
jgi:uncharacterized protein YkwD